MIGRLLRKAGFRWIFPIGTMPLPWHPLIGVLFSFAPPLWIGWLALSSLIDPGRGLVWWHPLVAGLLLGLAMSVPVVSWALMAFRAPLAQAMLFGGSMILLMLDVAMGRAAPGWGLLPLAFALLYLVQRIGGMRAMARLEQTAENWSPVDPGDATIVLRGEISAEAIGRRLIERADIARIVLLPDRLSQHSSEPPGMMLHHLSEAGRDRLLRACEGTPPPGWYLPGPGNPPVLLRRIDDLPDAQIASDALEIIFVRYRSRLRLVSGRLYRIGICGDQGERSVIWGRAQIVGPIPLFTCFHWTAILGGRSEWHVGFLRQTPVLLGMEIGPAAMVLPEIFLPRPDNTGAGSKVARSDDALIFDGPAPTPAARMAAAALAERERVAAFWDQIAKEPTEPVDDGMIARLLQAPGLFRTGDGMRLIGWLKSARAARHRDHVIRAARLIERLPDAEFTACAAALHDVVNSRILAGEWRIAADMDLTQVPKNCPRFGNRGGFGLAIHTPRLYARFAGLGAQERALVDALAASLDGHHFLK